MNLQDLIAERKAGRSYEQISAASGGTPTAGRLQQLATSPLRSFPDPDTIRALSTSLRVPVRVVVAASAESLGLETGAGTSRLEAWLPSEKLGDLSAAGVEAVLSVVNVLVGPPQPRSAAVDGGMVLFIPDPTASGPHDPLYPLCYDALAAAFPERDGFTERAIQRLARLMGPHLSELTAERSGFGLATYRGMPDNMPDTRAGDGDGNAISSTQAGGSPAQDASNVTQMKVRPKPHFDVTFTNTDGENIVVELKNPSASVSDAIKQGTLLLNELRWGQAQQLVGEDSQDAWDEFLMKVISEAGTQQIARAARHGTAGNRRDNTTGEGSQDPGDTDPV